MLGKTNGAIGPSAESRCPHAGKWSVPLARITESRLLEYLLGVEITVGRRARLRPLVGFSINRLYA